MVTRWLQQYFRDRYPDVKPDIAVSPDHAKGDYSTNLPFLLAKKDKAHPMDAGAGAVASLKENKEAQEMFETIEVAPPGFVNFTLKPAYLRQQLRRVHADGPEYGKSSKGKGKRVVLEYSQPNIAKPMHVGHLRNTMIGQAFGNILEFLGYDVVRWNYIGDWGTQFGKLIAAYKRWGKREEVEQAPIETMLKLYVRFHEEMKTSPDLEKDGQEEFRKLEGGDVENRELWEWFRSESLKGFQKTYDTLGVTFTIVKGESAYEKDMAPLVASLRAKGIATESQGAVIIDLESFKLPPIIVQKSDGASTYFTRDVAALQSRLREYQPEKMLYVVGNEQSLHFQQLLAVAHILGLDAESEIMHIKYGLVLGESGQKMATREGRIIPADEVVAKACSLALKIVREKNPSLADAEKDAVAEAVGIGALIYNDLSEHRNSDITFDWEKMLDFSGNSGPYLQYTYARLASIRRKAGRSFLKMFFSTDLAVLEHELELRLMRKLLDFPDVVEKSAELYVTNNIALYLYELANDVNRYYETVRILDSEQSRYKDGRIFLLESVMAVLKNGLGLLGIQTLERI